MASKGNIETTSTPDLILDGLKSLSLETAIAIADHYKGSEISMLGLVELAPEVAEVLAEAKVCVYLAGPALQEYQKHY